MSVGSFLRLLAASLYHWRLIADAHDDGRLHPNLIVTQLERTFDCIGITLEDAKVTKGLSQEIGSWCRLIL